MIDYKKYSAEQIENLKQSFIANECDSDEYRETQPFKGIGYISDVCQLLRKMSDEAFRERVNMQIKGEGEEAWEKHQPTIDDCSERAAKLLNKMAAWASAVTGHGYDGDEELKPVMRDAFDIFMEMGEHPYGFTESECDEWISEM